ncbi:MAG TPA: hypothetical protein PLR06_09530 [Cyclobacteriaceae bacterium]|nr:hypothetical protein [Cyclobacteriaceae bacterium]
MRLTSEQIRLIEHEVNVSISIPTLGDDLMDHLICDLELRLDEGASFEDALRSSLLELAPEGLKEIQNETELLLNSNLLTMKKVTFSIGLLSSMMMAGGWTMSVLHYPGAGNFYTAGVASFGFMAFVVLFLPLAALNHFKSNPGMPKHEKLRLISGLICGFITVFAMVLKIKHMPGANLSLLLGTVLFIFWFLPSLFYSMYRKSVA